jgi:hypothetical protein
VKLFVILVAWLVIAVLTICEVRFKPNERRHGAERKV